MTQSNKTKTTGLLETVTHQTGWKLPRLFPSPFDAPRPPVAIDGLAPSDRYLRQPFNPRISVVVPNYNHAPFLAQRLNSIYRQSYEPFEVILLDDCSTDDSLSVLNAYKAKFPRITRILANSSNTGSPFRQWKRGLEEAQGDLVWIAESDDFCDRDFLARLVPFFNDEAVNLAYAKTTFVDVKGKPLSSSFDDYVRDISPTKWAHDYVETAHNEVKQAMGLKNTIPNVSGVLFRKPPVLDVVKNDVWLNMKICGDWVFYLHVIRGGKIGYCQQTNNYYRYHPANTSSAAKHRQPSYYKEHAVVAKTIARLYQTTENALQTHYQLLRRYWLAAFKNYKWPAWSFDEVYNLNDILAERARRLPNVMIACHDFAGGGGEMFPIRLAVELQQQGYAVTFFDLNGLIPNLDFRKNLPAGIPVIQRNDRLKDVASLIEDLGIEVIHSHHLSADAFFADVCRSIRDAKIQPAPKHVVTLHGMDELCPDAFKMHQRKLTEGVDHWVYISKKNLAPFTGTAIEGQPRFSQIPVGMRIQPVVACDRTALGIPEEAFVVCVASRVIQEKGWKESVVIIEQAREKSGRDIHLILIGEGPVKEELEHIGVPGYVHLLGFQKNVSGFYAMSDVGLLATTYLGESCPLTIVECLAAGRPVVASDLGEIRSMLTPAPGKLAGIIFSLCQDNVPIAAVADAIALYATNPVEYQRATKNCGAAAERYSLDEIAHKYGAVYTAVLGTRRLIPTNTTIGFAAFPSGRHRATIDCSYNMQWVSANSGLSRDLQILINRIIKHLINKPKLTGIILYVSRRWLGFK